MTLTPALRASGASETGSHGMGPGMGLYDRPGLNPLPKIIGVEPVHPLALFHDRLLSGPLTQALGDIPPGSRFEAAAAGAPGGVLRRPDASDVVTVWQSLGEVIEITHPDGTVTPHGWQEVDAALGGDVE